MTSLSDLVTPVSAKVGEAELLACLVLVAPSGMTADDRHAWIQVARETLKGIPEDLLKLGCWKVRRQCKFVSEIVPTIIAEVGETWEARKRAVDRERWASMPRSLPKPEPKPDYIGAKQISQLIKSIKAPA